MSSKSKTKAEATKEELGGNDNKVGEGTKKCKQVFHWITIVVKDSDDKLVKGVKPTLDVDGSVTSVPLDKKGKYATGKCLVSAADAKITFPDLFDCDWWPDGSTAPAPVGEKELTVGTDGNCAERLAANEGLRSYKDIWDAPQNATVKGNHPVPNALLETDKLLAPDKKVKSVTKAVDKEWKFIVRALKLPKLRIVLVDKDLKPVKDLKWELTAVVAKKGTTAANGMAEALDVDPKKTAGTLKVTLPKPPAPPKKKKAAAEPKLPDPPPYPLPIKVAEFEEEDPDTETPPTEIEFDLLVGSLPSHKDKTGTFARLSNLGFLMDVKAADDIIKRSVKAYQKDILKQATPTGAHADIKDEIETRHSKA